ncbi:MAG: hydroxymethylbilane synthase [Candidatus Riflebacteria bacterium]|nr:hydroxymethylbilane synthase [Candidatus Riflebacteria bacterium]
MIKIGTRGSKLALTQTRMLINLMKISFPEVQFEEIVIKTLGDREQNVPLYKMGGRGLFIKEIEEALIGNEIDIAVHSLKDVPHQLPNGLCLGAVSSRVDPRDVMISNVQVSNISQIPNQFRIGTSSLRRRAQLKSVLPEISFVDFRGNLDTRLRKLHEGNVDGLILAAAGLERLGIEEPHILKFSVDEIIPAAGQGLLAVECRISDMDRLKPILGVVENSRGRAACEAERAFLAEIDSGCQAAIGCYSSFESDFMIESIGFVSDPEGKKILKNKKRFNVNDAKDGGKALAQDLISQGALDILSGKL